MNQSETNLLNIISATTTQDSIQIGDYSINYVRAGSGPGTLLIHGINMGWGQWYPNIAAIAEYATVYAIDLPGAGASTSLHPDDKKFPNDLVEAVEQFIIKKDLKQVNLIGHSIGGWVALKVALRKKVSLGKLVLISPLGFSKKTPAKYRALGFRIMAQFLSKTVMRVSRSHMKEFATSVLHRPEALRQEFIDYYYEALRDQGHAHPFLLINRFSGILNIRDEFVLLDELSQIQEPTLIIVGEQDAIVPPNKFHLQAFQLMPHAKLIIFSESGHVAATEESEKFNITLKQFLTV